MFGGHLLFTAPWILSFLAALPVLWWLLRLTPPSPRKTIFPALSLLRDLVSPAQTPACTPWWLLLLRVIIAALVITAFAGPLMDPQPSLPGSGAVLIAIDNDWAAARGWDVRQDAMKNIIAQAERENREVILLPTAPAASGEALQPIGPMAAKAAYSSANRLMPMPWPADWKSAKSLLNKIDPDTVGYALWLNSGLGNKDAAAFYDGLKPYGAHIAVRILRDAATPVYTLLPPKTGDGDNNFIIRRADTSGVALVSVTAMGAGGRSLGHAEASFADGAPQTSFALDVPLDVHNEITRFEIDGQRTAATTLLLDEDWQHRPVGLIGDKSEEAEHSLMSGIFYIDRALKPYADIHLGKLDQLLTQNMSVIMATDAEPLDNALLPALIDWIKKGGTLVRFAGDRLAGAQNPHEVELLPVALRTGDRAMGGSMSWATPQKLHEFPSASPFRGLTIPADVNVSRQILAEPSSGLAQKTWAMLDDGTPLVTAKAIGTGWSILFHVPARSEWSNLPLSGLFVDMLRRIVDLSHAASGGEINFSTLAPLRMLDGFGDEQALASAAQPIENSAFSSTEIGPQHPPGTYGSDSFKRALNLGPALGQPEALKGLETSDYKLDQSATDLQPRLLLATLLLLLADFFLSLCLRGILDIRSMMPPAAMLLLIAFFLYPTAAQADDKAGIEFTSKTYLAYINTGNREIDHVSQAGLNGLARILQRRTSLDQVGVAAINPETDELVFFPLIYWPLNSSASPLSPAAATKVNDYLHHGGMILFDSGPAGAVSMSSVIQNLLSGVDLPPLIHIPENHVLRRSFYLLDQFPGRDAGSDLWLEPEQIANYDGVATVIAGSANWAGAWAVGEDGQPLFPCTPGAETQREQAYRFGVNLVMYALTGNYKSDQMHAQALLERLGK